MSNDDRNTPRDLPFRPAGAGLSPTAQTMRLTAADVLQRLSYEPRTGFFRWLQTRARSANAGDVAGCLDLKGYRLITVNQVVCKAHRLAWLVVTGEHPRGEIDHINGDRDDNRWANLRDVDVAINRQNRRAAVGAVGLLGVSRSGDSSFRATIKKDRRSFHLGTFPTPEEAHAAYMAAKREIHDGCAY